MLPAVGLQYSTAGSSCVGDPSCSSRPILRPLRHATPPACTQIWSAAASWSAAQPCRGAAAGRACGLASTSGLTARSRSSRRLATAVDPPFEGGDTLQADPAADSGSDSDEDIDLSEFDLNMGSLNLEYVEYCQERFEIGDLVEVGLGANDLPAVYLHHPNGSELEVYLHGANITSWRKPDGTDILYLQPDNEFDGVEPIKGGVPVVFPQYGRGMLPTNGLLQRMHWSIAETGVADPEIARDPAPSVALWAEADSFTLGVWPHRFEAMYTISLMEHDDFPDTTPPDPKPAAAPDADDDRCRSFACCWTPCIASHLAPATPTVWGCVIDFEYRPSTMSACLVCLQSGFSPTKGVGELVEGEAVDEDPLQLRCVLEIANTDDREFTFTSALQTHFAVKPLGDYPLNSQFVKLLGLGGKMGLDYARNPSHPSVVQQEGDYIQFGDRPMDTLLVDTDKTDVKLCPGNRTHHQIYMRRGFRDTGVVNPHMRAPDAWRHFVSVPSARVGRPVTLQPGETWVGEMVIRSFDSMWESPLFEFEHEGANTKEPPPLVPTNVPNANSQWR